MNMYSVRDISGLLPRAYADAETPAELNFVKGMAGMFGMFGEELVLSDRQFEQLSCIADPNCLVRYGPSGVEM